MRRACKTLLTLLMLLIVLI